MSDSDRQDSPSSLLRQARLLAGAALGLCIAPAFAAIGILVVPQEADGVPGNSATQHPFGVSAECSDGFRFQQVIDGDVVGGANISGLAFRLDDGQGVFGPQTYGGAIIKLSSTLREPGNLSTTFADNPGTDETLVFAGDLILQGSVDANPTNPFDLDIPINVPFQLRSGSNLLIDVSVEDCPPGVNNVFFDGDTRDVERIYAMNRNSATADAPATPGGLVTLVVVSSPPPTAPVVFCPFNSGGTGDNLSRGFYVSNFSAPRLDKVRLKYYPNTSGVYTIELTARENSYDGRLIGSPRRVSFQATGGTPVTPTFDFGGASVTEGATVTFSQTVISQPSGSSIFYDTASDSGGCADVTQTSGTTPPLSTFRRNSAGVQIDVATRLRGLGGNWAVVDHNGEGFMIDVTESNQLVAIWFTYDEFGEQMWLIGVAGNFNSNQATMKMDRLSGPVFGPDFDPGDLIIDTWGTITLRFNDCQTGEVYYNSIQGDGEGIYDIVKVYNTEQQVCD